MCVLPDSDLQRKLVYLFSVRKKLMSPSAPGLRALMSVILKVHWRMHAAFHAVLKPTVLRPEAFWVCITGHACVSADNSYEEAFPLGLREQECLFTIMVVIEKWCINGRKPCQVVYRAKGGEKRVPCPQRSSQSKRKGKGDRSNGCLGLSAPLLS